MKFGCWITNSILVILSWCQEREGRRFGSRIQRFISSELRMLLFFPIPPPSPPLLSSAQKSLLVPIFFLFSSVLSFFSFPFGRWQCAYIRYCDFYYKAEMSWFPLLPSPFFPEMELKLRIFFSSRQHSILAAEHRLWQFWRCNQVMNDSCSRFLVASISSGSGESLVSPSEESCGCLFKCS